MSETREKDAVTGVETTGHEWDGIKELNNPLPKWWLYVLYASIVWAIGYWIAMPAWPLLNSYTSGLLGYSSRAGVAETIRVAQDKQELYRKAIAEAELSDIQGNADLLEFALAGGRSAFGDNCAPCHGSGAQGAAGYPNLNDDDWLWGGTLEEISQTIAYGIRSGHEEAHENEMPAFGRDEILATSEIAALVDYLLVLSGGEADPASAKRGAALFTENCAACHGEDGAGDSALGAPNLADSIWLYGGDRKAISETIRNSRSGVMPFWQGRLDDITVKQLVVYVHSLGGGQ